MILKVCCDVQIMSSNGIELIRTWAFLNGQQDPYTANGSQAIQPQVHLTMTCPVHTCLGAVTWHDMCCTHCGTCLGAVT